MREFRKLRPLSLHRTRFGHPESFLKKDSVWKAVGLACMLLAGVAFGSIFPYMAESNRYFSYFVHQYLVGNHSGSFSSGASGSFFSAMRLQTVVLFFS